MEFAIGTFEGPLDLLLALVRKEEMDIMEIDIHRITQKYLAIIQKTPQLNLNEGGEFIQMASTLIYIKSRSLLPQEAEEILEEEGPSKEDLIQALAQHNYYLKAAEKLNERPSLNRDIWTCCSSMDFVSVESEEIQADGLFSLIGAFRKALKRAYTFKIKISLPSVFEWIHKIQSFFIKGKTRSFQQLIRQQKSTQKEEHWSSVHQILLSFLSILELGKLGVVTMVQKDKDIQIQTHREIDEKIFYMLGKDLSFDKPSKAMRKGSVVQ